MRENVSIRYFLPPATMLCPIFTQRSCTAAMAAFSILAPPPASAAPAYAYHSAVFLPSSLHGELLAIAKGGVPAKRRRKNLMEAGMKQQELQSIIKSTATETEGEILPPQNVQEEPAPEPDSTVPTEEEETEISPWDRLESRVCSHVLRNFANNPGFLESVSRRLFSRWGFSCANP